MSVPTVTGDRVRHIVAGVLGVAIEDLSSQPTLAAHDWDSLASLEALAQLEHEFGVDLDLREFHRALTIGALIELVETSRGARTS